MTASAPPLPAADAAHPPAWQRRNRTALFAAIASAVVLAAALGVAVMAWRAVGAWEKRDVEVQTGMVYRSVSDQLSAGAAEKYGGDISEYLQRIAEDSRIMALGYCTPAGEMKFVNGVVPDGLRCSDLPKQPTRRFRWVNANGEKLIVSVFPPIGDFGRLFVAPDFDVIGQRVAAVRLYTALVLVCVGLGFCLLAIALVIGLRRRWTQSLRAAIHESRPGVTPRVIEHFDLPAKEEIAALLTELRVERRFAKGIHVHWSPESLRLLLREELPGARVIVVSNREPYIHNRVDGEVRLQTPASGLVSALEPVMRACGGSWIAHGGGSADRETVDENDRLMVPPNDPAFVLRRVWLTDEEQDGYYYGLANEGLWPLCHIAFVRPIFREQDWLLYREVNERFADVVVQEANCENPIVLVQDYHFALLPRMVRKRLPKATIVTFWHIPWPNSETFSIFPWREEILDGLLGSSILGFHTQFHCNNFLETVDRFVESRINRESFAVSLRGQETFVRPYPISIEWPPHALAAQAPVEECRANVRRRFDLDDKVRIVVGVERFDYTKGILDRMMAVDDLLTTQPQWRGKLALIQVAAPTRGKLDAYSALQRDAERLADEINTRHGQSGCPPIRLVVRHYDPSEVLELFRAGDVCVVSSLHDGMNLVAKEFVAARDDQQGVLILSSFAGAAHELPEALIVNPYNTRGMAQALEEALRMPAEEQRDRMRLMAAQISERNVYRWAAQMLFDAAWLRRRERFAATAAA